MASQRYCDARDLVLAIPEIVEAILLHVDMVTLLVAAARVNRFWNGVIETSPRIQQKLYFQPAPVAVASAKPARPLFGVAEGQAHDAGSNNAESDDADIGGGRGCGVAPSLNPLLIEKFGPCFFDFGETYGFIRRADSFFKLPWTRTDEVLDVTLENTVEAAPRARKRRRCFTRRGASWRRMLVSQPPPPLLGYVWMDHDDLYVEGQKARTAMVRQDPIETHGHGLRMGFLYDIIQHRAGHHECSSLWFRVIWNKPQEPFSSTLGRRICQRMLAESHVFVEFRHVCDDAFRNHARQPPSPEAFDTVFRCDEFERVDPETKVEVAEEFEIPGFTIEAAIFSHKIEQPVTGRIYSLED